MNSFSRKQKLYQFLVSTFCVIVILSNLITAKLFCAPFQNTIPLPAGLITYPLTFLICDWVTELYGARCAKFMVILGFLMSLLGYMIIQITLILPPFDLHNQAQVSEVFGLNGIVVFSSMFAYAIAQVIDIQLFDWLKRITQSKHLWLRNNVSTLISQFIDTVIIITLVFSYGFGYSWDTVFRIALYTYLYKSLFSIIDTPIFYLGVWVSNRYTNNSRINQLQQSA